jgi:hypothetical protein
MYICSAFRFLIIIRLKMKTYRWILFILLSGLIFLISCKKETVNHGTIQLLQVKAGDILLNFLETTPNITIDETFLVRFSDQLDTSSVKTGVHLVKLTDNSTVSYQIKFEPDLKNFSLTPDQILGNSTTYQLQLTSGIKGYNKQTFAGDTLSFSTVEGKLSIRMITLNQIGFDLPTHPQNIDNENMQLEILFSHPLDPQNYQSFFTLSGNIDVIKSISQDNKTVTITNAELLSGYKRYYFNISGNLQSQSGFPFDGFSNYFVTGLDSTLKFPLITDEELLDLLQEKTFRYFYDFAHPSCGLARERNSSGNIVTIGGSGFGVMALIVGMDRGFITRQQGLDRLGMIVTFLETCDRFHGAWPHWLNGSTGKVVPFSENDDGADLVETSYMVEGLLTMRQYLDPIDPAENELIGRITTMLDEVEYDWFTRGQNVLYWHWSPNNGWIMNMKIVGYNETLITYIVAATSTTHPINPAVYHQGYARNGGIMNGNSYYGYTLPLGSDYGGPLFFTHYSHLGLDPRNLQDTYANYWEQGVNMSLINWAYCVDNPMNWLGYRTDCWGLTASDNPWGYNAHSPTNDLGVITPTAAVSSLPYTPEQSMAAIRHFYFILGDRLWGPYGFYDAFDPAQEWWADSYLAIDEGPIICMIENYRTGLLWDLFMSSPEVQQGLDKLGFSY